MRIVGAMWKLLVGVKDALVLVAMLLFFGALYFALANRPETAAAGRGALLLQLRGTIVEQPEIPTPSFSASDAFQPQTRQFRLRDLVRAIDAAATDDHATAVVLDLDGFAGGGQVALADVGAALDRVRAAKKPVLAYATGYSDDSYLIAAHASEVWLDPMGMAMFAGPGGSHLYYKGLLDKLGVEAHVYRVGAFKSAVEPYTRAEQSPEAKAANEALAGALWHGWLENVAKARPKAKVASFAADPVAATARGDLARAALDAGVVDHLGDRDAFVRHVAGLVGTGKRDMDFAAIAYDPWVAGHAAPTGDGAVGIITVAGVISDGEAGPGTAGGDTIARLVNRAVADGQVKALVLRVDSPGGSALAAERIRLALASAKARGLPIVVSMGNVAASGGYWVSTVSDKVFAEPTTITGSIGVFGIIPTFKGALAKIGVTGDGIATTPLTGQPDIVGGTNAAFDTIIQRSVENIYARFIALVSGARHLPPARVNEIGQGRVWDGGTARQIGLVDAFGGIDDAVAEAARRARLDPGAAHAVWIERPPTIGDRIARMFAGTAQDGGPDDLLSTLSRTRVATLWAAVDDARALSDGAAVQARCLECPAAPHRARNPALSKALLTWMTR